MERLKWKEVCRLGLLLLGVLTSFSVRAQYETVVEVKAAPNATVKAALEKNSSLLLTELNNAQGEQRSLSLKGINIDKEAASSLLTMWEVCPFRCDELDIIENCLHSASGFQIRNIPVIMEPRGGEHFDEDKYQEIVLNFDRSGKITDLCFSMSNVMYKQIMGSNREVTDLRRRSLVVDFVEQFRTAYNRKDISYLNDIFSEDALIITGKVVRRIPNEMAGTPNIEYVTNNKKQYLERLEKVFRKNERVNVVFEDIKVNTHKTNPNIYGVKLIQHWNSTTYNDKGYLFLLWDFADESHPKIHVRTWQPFEDTPKEEVFELSDFKVKGI